MSSEAKTTKAYKVSNELKEKLEALFTQSGLETQEAFIERIAEQYEIQLLKEGATGYKKQLDELDYHTRRVNELYLSMINTEAAERLDLVQSYETKLKEHAEILFSQEQIISDFGKQTKHLQEEIAKGIKENGEITAQLGQAHEITKKDNQLVDELNRRIHTLTGLLDENKQAVDENKEMKTQLSKLTELTEKQTSQLSDFKDKLKAAEELRVEQNKQLSERHKEDLERLAERKELEKERELLSVRAEYQAKIEKINSDDTEKFKGLYEQIEKLRERLDANNIPKEVKPKSKQNEEK